MRRFHEKQQVHEAGHYIICHHPTCANGGSAKCRSVWKITLILWCGSSDILEQSSTLILLPAQLQQQLYTACTAAYSNGMHRASLVAVITVDCTL